MSVQASREHRLDHVVVLMFENRSFDNLLGHLYRAGERPAFEGLSAGPFSNPVPPDAPGAELGAVATHPAEGFASPYPDPGEEYPHVNTQLFSMVSPASNRFADDDKMETPFNLPDTPCPPPTMEGFVTDYINTYRNTMGRLPSRDRYAQIMSCYTPDQLPVLSGLARGFLCFDHWFCEVPSQTYTNRSFFHAGTSSGFVNNGPAGKFESGNDAPTIFERLMAAKKSWKVYFDPAQFVSATALIHARRLAPYFATHFAPTLDFLEDARTGNLPNYAFIEPNMFHPHTDMHPHSGAKLADALGIPPPDTIIGGERLLATVYDAVRTGDSPSGSNWSNTALLITFDEHGGTFDHVPPPSAAPPSEPPIPGEQGFMFDRSGLRIPSILVSAWVPKGSVETAPFRSTSLIATLREWWSLGDPLTRRDASAPNLLSKLANVDPTPPDGWPEVRPLKHGPLAAIGGALEEAVEEGEVHFGQLERDLLGEALHFEARCGGAAVAVDLERITHREAHVHFRRIGTRFFPQVAGVRG
jgi:phospholipase C